MNKNAFEQRDSSQPVAANIDNNCIDDDDVGEMCLCRQQFHWYLRRVNKSTVYL